MNRRPTRLAPVEVRPFLVTLTLTKMCTFLPQQDDLPLGTYTPLRGILNVVDLVAGMLEIDSFLAVKSFLDIEVAVPRPVM